MRTNESFLLGQYYSVGEFEYSVRHMNGQETLVATRVSLRLQDSCLQPLTASLL